MAIKSSTGSLTKEQKTAQDKRYAQNHEYDYVIIGSGSSSLTVGSLLAKAGYKVCMLEAHDTAGGYLQTFKMGEYKFCAQVHYTWGCGPGGKVYEFLKKIGLEKDVTWELYDADGYDHMKLPDGNTVKIPYGYDKLADNVTEAYPDQKEPMQKFVGLLKKFHEQLDAIPRNPNALKVATQLWKFGFLIKRRNYTLQDVFDEAGLSKEARAVLIANAGDFMSPPEELSIFAYLGLFGGYNTGAYYPTKHYKHYVDSITDLITSHNGCHIYYETRVDKINTEGDKVVGVETADGKKFTAKNYICNMDPQSAAKIIGWEKFSKKEQKQLSYEYAPSGTVIYLGLKDIDLRDYGFGRNNVWHLQQWDMNKTWKEQLAGDFEKCWFFMSTPTLHTKESGTTPPGGQILEIATVTDYESFKEAKDRSYAEYNKMKQQLTDRLLDLIEEKYIPNLRKHIAVKVIGTSVTNEDFVMAPKGNAYGSVMNPKNMGIGRLTSKTPFTNFHWCNASSGYGGLYGTVHAGITLYMDLTGDRFYDKIDIPSIDDRVSQAIERYTKQVA